MTFESASQFHVYFLWVKSLFSSIVSCVLNVTALVGAFSVIVKTDGSFAAQLQVCSVVELEVREPLT